jgi:HSP20 family protein
MENLFNRFLGDEEGEWPMVEFVPRTDVVETDGAMEVTVELPGMKAEEFKVEIKDNALWITGEKKEEKEEKNKTYHRIERRHGKFERILPMPAYVDAKKVEAAFRDGVLKVTVPKTEAVKPKQIAVKS